MEAIITIVGFLGAGKTTLLKHLTEKYINEGWNPFIILNDYENANLDAQQFVEYAGQNQVKSLSGSCVCCSGIHVLRDMINKIPERNQGITLIEANGTTDACSLAGFLGVGIEERFLPPVQISVVDAKNWQKRGEHNELEANQIQLSTLIVLSHVDDVSDERLTTVVSDIRKISPLVDIITSEEIDVSFLPKLSPSKNTPRKFDHFKSHWASSSIDLPRLPNTNSIDTICNTFPETILRVKGCAQIGNEVSYTYFERTADGQIYSRPFNGIPPTGAKLLTVGLGSSPSLLEEAINNAVQLEI